jgi:hypothetical protein
VYKFIETELTGNVDKLSASKGELIMAGLINGRDMLYWPKFT